MNKNIENSHVLVICPGPSLKRYWNKIRKFIKNNDVITFGCNHISDFITPDYHFWNSLLRWEQFANCLNKKSNLIFPTSFLRREIRKKWKGSFKKIKVTKRYWGVESYNLNSAKYKRCKVKYKNGIMYGCFNAGSVAIFRSYIKHASKISVVGLDGYSYDTYKDLKKKKVSQHCYGKGMTDGFTYIWGRKKDIDSYRTLNMIYKYGKKNCGFGFEILTPTVYKKFYNPRIFGIKEKYEGEEPIVKEYKKIKHLLNQKKRLKKE